MKAQKQQNCTRQSLNQVGSSAGAQANVITVALPPSDFGRIGESACTFFLLTLEMYSEIPVTNNTQNRKFYIDSRSNRMLTVNLFTIDKRKDSLNSPDISYLTADAIEVAVCVYLKM